MAENVSATFRQNCYDDAKRQRIVFYNGGTYITNEDIAVNGTVNFSLACIQAQQVSFGETPSNTISIGIVNEDGRFTSSDISGKEFRCEIGVEVSRDNYHAPSCAISAVSNMSENVSVHSVAPYVRGNVQFGDTIDELEEGYDTKIVFLYDTIFFVVRHEDDVYYAKHTRTGAFTFGDYSVPSDSEKAMLDRILSYDYLSGISFYNGGMCEFLYADNVAPKETWNDLNATIWSGVKTKTWGYYGGYTTFTCIKYESVPYGVWKFDRPRKVNSAVLTLSGKDRMYLFDEDSISFVESMPQGMITAENLIRAIAAYKSVPVGDLSSLNAFKTRLIDPKVYYQYKSLKDLLSYAFEVCGSNAMIDRRGCLSAMSANATAVELPYVYSFDVADYVAHTIGKMLVYHEGDYFVYQEDNTVLNGATYEFGENPYFNVPNPADSWFSQNIHKKYGGFRNAITTSDADYSMWCDDSYSWTDEDSVEYIEPIFSMQVVWNGIGKVTYTNYGEETRPIENYDRRIENVTSINDQNLQGFNKAQRANKLYFDENGLTIDSDGLRILNANGETVFDADDEGNLTLTGKVQTKTGFIGNCNITEGGIVCGDEDKYISLAKGGYDARLEVLTKDGSIYKVIDISNSLIEFSEYEEYPQILGRAQVFASNGTLNLYGSSRVCVGEVSTTTGSSNTVLNAVSGTGMYEICKTSSLRKFKDNIKTIENASEKVDNLRGVSFTSKCKADDQNRKFYGFIAEEVEKIAPELCTYENGELQGVQYDRVCALLLEDNKACHKRIAELEERLTEIERRLK